MTQCTYRFSVVLAMVTIAFLGGVMLAFASLHYVVPMILVILNATAFVLLWCVMLLNRYREMVQIWTQKEGDSDHEHSSDH